MVSGDVCGNLFLLCSVEPELINIVGVCAGIFLVFLVDE